MSRQTPRENTFREHLANEHDRTHESNESRYRSTRWEHARHTSGAHVESTRGHGRPTPVKGWQHIISNNEHVSNIKQYYYSNNYINNNYTSQIGYIEHNLWQRPKGARLGASRARSKIILTMPRRLEALAVPGTMWPAGRRTTINDTQTFTSIGRPWCPGYRGRLRRESRVAALPLTLAPLLLQLHLNYCWIGV